ncbi:cellulose binding domain-containing protein, partial [Micromonospora sp. NPDC050686]|uniref:cellulose binding domain-containing protein n=1 Tax=Micromonospora sp. NPDC050686 TaxID=3154631 RepID=UPI0033EC617B
GEADGCRYTAGSFQPDLAFSLANGAPNPPTTAPPTTAPPTTAPPTTAPPTTAPPTTTPPPTGNGCSASVAVNQWSGGFTASVTVTAGSAALNGWTVTIALPGGAAITGTWNAQASGSSGTVRFTNVSYNGQRLRGARPAGPPRPSIEPVRVQRRASNSGIIMVAGQKIALGRLHRHQTVTVTVSETTLAIELTDDDTKVVRRTTTQPVRSIKGQRPRIATSVS